MKKKTFAVDIDGTITENGGGRIHLDALEALRRLTNMGHDVIYVTGRSSVEAYLLSVFGGTRKIAVVKMVVVLLWMLIIIFYWEILRNVMLPLN